MRNDTFHLSVPTGSDAVVCGPETVLDQITGIYSTSQNMGLGLESAFSSAAYGNGIIVGITYSGASGNNLMMYDNSFAVSTDYGVTWKRVYQDKRFTEVCFGAGVFVATADNSDTNAFRYSTDGFTWIDSTALPRSIAITNLVFVNGVFIGLTGSLGYSYSSADGITWTETNIGLLFSAIRDCGTFAMAAGSSDGLLYKTTDGVSYTVAQPSVITATTTGAASSENDIASNSTTFIAINASVVKTSTDGVTWTDRTITLSSPISVAIGGTTAVLTSLNNRNVSVSTDSGVTWTDYANALPVGITYYRNKVRYVNDRFFVVGYGYSGTTYATSTDGVTWSAGTFPATIAVSNIVYGNGVYVLITTGSTAYYSTDATTWNSVSLGVTPRDVCFNAVSGKFIAITSTVRKTSTDGATWTADETMTCVFPINFATVSKLAVSSNGTLYVASSNERNSYYSTDDGLTWNPRANLERASVVSSGLVHVAYSATSDTFVEAYNSQLFAVTRADLVTGSPYYGNTYLNYGNGKVITRYATSSDGGVTWTFNPDNSTYWNYMVFDTGTALVQYNNSGIAFSTNGTKWHQIPIENIGNVGGVWVSDVNKMMYLGPTVIEYDAATGVISNRFISPRWTSIKYGNGWYVMVGLTSTYLSLTEVNTKNTICVQASRDGKAWYQGSFQDSKIYATNPTVNFVDGSFIIFGDNGKMATSADGLSWRVTSLDYLNYRSDLGSVEAMTTYKGIVYVWSQSTMYGYEVGEKFKSVGYFPVAVNSDGTATFLKSAGNIFVGDDVSRVDVATVSSGAGSKSVAVGSTAMVIAPPSTSYLATRISLDGVLSNINTSVELPFGRNPDINLSYHNGAFRYVNNPGQYVESSDGLTWTTKPIGFGNLKTIVGDGTATLLAMSGGTYAVSNNIDLAYCVHKLGSGVTKVAVSNRSVAYINSDGSLWELNAAGLTQHAASGFIDVQVAHPAYNAFVALKGDGTVWSFGVEVNGVLGFGTSNGSTVIPLTQVTGLAGVAKIKCGGINSSYAITSVGDLYAFGDSRYLGVNDGSGTFLTPTFVMANVADVTALNYFTAAVSTTNALWCWGNHGMFNYATQLTPATDAATDVATLYATDSNVFVIASNKTVWGMGANSSGQLGIGNTTLQTTLQQVTGVTATKLAVLANNVVAIDTSTSGVWCWGSNTNYHNGNATSTGNQTTPYSLTITNVANMVSSTAFTYVIKTDGTVVYWGNHTNHASYSSPTALNMTTYFKGKLVSNLFVSTTINMVVYTDGSIRVWGSVSECGYGADMTVALAYQVAIKDASYNTVNPTNITFATNAINVYQIGSEVYTRRVYSDNSIIAKSTDNGVTWTAVTPTGLPSNTTITSSCYFSGKFYVVCGYNSLYSSSDGVIWSAVGGVSFLSPSGQSILCRGLIAHGGWMYMFFDASANAGSKADPESETYIRTNDGTTWSAPVFLVAEIATMDISDPGDGGKLLFADAVTPGTYNTAGPFVYESGRITPLYDNVNETLYNYVDGLYYDYTGVSNKVTVNGTTFQTYNNRIPLSMGIEGSLLKYNGGGNYYKGNDKTISLPRTANAYQSQYYNALGGTLVAVTSNTSYAYTTRPLLTFNSQTIPYYWHPVVHSAQMNLSTSINNSVKIVSGHNKIVGFYYNQLITLEKGSFA